MGKFSRDKGKRGEREFASFCRQWGYSAIRTAQHKGKDGGEADVVGMPGLHIEVKRTESLRMYDAIDQAKRDAAPDMIPIVAHRKNDHEWLAILTAGDFMRMYREYEAGMALHERREDESK